MKLANEIQVGGDHYKAEYQHWDLMIDLETPCPVVYATKYVYRWRKKNGVQDLEKAIHCLQKAEDVGIELKKNEQLVLHFIHSNKMHINDAYAFNMILSGEYAKAIKIIETLIKEEEYYNPSGSGYVNQGEE